MSRYSPTHDEYRAEFSNGEAEFIKQYASIPLEDGVMYKISDNIYIEKESPVEYNLYVGELEV